LRAAQWSIQEFLNVRRLRHCCFDIVCQFVLVILAFSLKRIWFGYRLNGGLTFLAGPEESLSHL
jgi:hypothetical protein